MLKPMNLFLVSHDAPKLEIGEGGLHRLELERVVECRGSILWDMQGELRLLPPAVLIDALRIEHQREELRRLGRAQEVEPGGFFTREQTIVPHWLVHHQTEELGQVFHEDAANRADDHGPAEDHPN